MKLFVNSLFKLASVVLLAVAVLEVGTTSMFLLYQPSLKK